MARAEPAGRPRRGCWNWVRRAMVASTLVAGVGAVAGLLTLGFLYRRHVIEDPGPHIDAAHVRSIIAQESPVYYRDGVTRIGVFFEDEHRQYVPFERLPLAWTMGIVAAEDGVYWSHRGVNLKHIARAMRDNLIAGRLVAGGSTLSQQTAKNLYYRPDRSLRSKGVELLNTLRLEAHFDKRQILTFYANQFHVSGNGRGLGIGARYFFDKEVEQLSVVEAAFLSGLVKGPSNYDPFIGDEDRRAQSRERAHDRTRYVLRRLLAEPIEHLVPPRAPGERAAAHEARLLEAGRIRAEAQRLLDEGFELPFRRGTFRYDSSAVLDEVSRRLREPPFDAVLEVAGIDDPSTAGLKVITTLDAEAQHAATYALWHHLTEVGAWLEAPGAEGFKVDARVRYDPERPTRVHSFRLAQVAQIVDGKHLEVDLGGWTCVVDRDAVVRAAVAAHRGSVGSSVAKAGTAEVDAFVAAFAPGDGVLVSLRDVDGEQLFCDLERRPELQGAVIALEDGEIRAMVGGNDNRNFNRATALRQMGSTWKPLVFHAALELGWGPDDTLDNRRNVFPFSTTFYYPRPDHTPEPELSMAWAGVRSENLASVWLLYHLTDRLERRQVRALAETLGLARRPGEAERDYQRRIQELGVLPTRGRLAEVDFLAARAELLASGSLQRPDDAVALRSLHYGWGFDEERARVRREGGRDAGARLDALGHAWTALQPRIEDCRAQHDLLMRAWSRGELPLLSATRDLSVMVDEAGIQVACGTPPEGFGPVEATLADVLSGEEPDGEAAPADGDAADADAADELDGAEPEELEPPAVAAPAPRRLRFPWSREPAAQDAGPVAVAALTPALPAVVPFRDVWIGGRLRASTLIELDATLQRRALLRQLEPDAARDLYDPDNLYDHPDFRVLLNLRYLEEMARSYGVESPIQRVLSLPLGANEVTIEELAAVYEGIVTGQAWTFPGTGVGVFPPPPGPTLLIAEIRDVDDRVLYRAEGLRRRVAPPEVGEMTADILRNVVLHGTGRRAARAALAGEHPIPLGGKTGTTNDFRNAVFAGFAPRAEGPGFVLRDPLTVVAYVGYDDNRPLRNKRIRLAGASGALPVWIGTVRGLADAGLLGEPEDGAAAGAEGWPLRGSASLVRLPVDARGVVVSGASHEEGQPGVLARLPAVVEEPVVRFSSGQRPVRRAPRTTEQAERPTLRDLWGRRRRPAPPPEDAP